MKLPITQIRGGLLPRYKLLVDYKFVFQSGHRRLYFVIPEGFKYDGATFGSFLFWRKSMHEEPATIAHDWIYYNRGKVNAKYLNHAPYGDVSKKTADNMFLNATRRGVNIQNWRSAIASGMFKTVGHIFWNLGRKL